MAKANIDHAASENLRPYALLLEKLRQAGLRPTRQRLALARLLFDHEGDRHVTAESLHEDAVTSGIKVSLATVYNTLHQFTEAGLLKELVIEPSRTYFDTNTEDHHHFYFKQSGDLRDIHKDEVEIAKMPETPAGRKVSNVHVIITVDEAA